MFRIKKFITRSNNQDFLLEFDVNDNEKLNISLFLGENGTGKSVMLAKLAEALRATLDSVNDYKIDFFILEFTNESGEFLKSALENDQLIKFYKGSQEILQNTFIHILNIKKILPISFLVNDKFNNSQNTESSHYKYLGLRQGNAIFAGASERRIIQGLLDKFQEKSYRKQIKDILHFIGRESEIRITYQTTIKSLTDAKKLTIDTPKERLKKFKMSEKYSEPTLKNFIKHIEQKRINKEAINNTISYNFDFDKNIGIDSIQYIKMLLDLDYISHPILSIKKNKNSSFDFSNLSSGEVNVLYTLINIATYATDGVIYLIDEPELSLHPKWQIEYIDILRRILSNINCHIFIASHSHLMVSDLQEKDSQIFAFLKNKDAINIHKIDYSTYAWNVETILYKVFHTRSFSNNSIKNDLVKLLSLCSSYKMTQEDKSQAQDLIDNLRTITFDSSDPINQILLDTQGKINGL